MEHMLSFAEQICFCRQISLESGQSCREGGGGGEGFGTDTWFSIHLSIMQINKVSSVRPAGKSLLVDIMHKLLNHILSL